MEHKASVRLMTPALQASFAVVESDTYGEQKLSPSVWGHPGLNNGLRAGMPWLEPTNTATAPNGSAVGKLVFQ